jgi:hemerythrin superfamily protein
MKTKKTHSTRTGTSTKAASKPTKARAPAREGAKGSSDRGFFAAVKGLITGDDDDSAPKATALLEKQHRKVERLFAAIDSANGNAKALVHELATDLLAHMVIEQKLFYPAALSIKEDLVLEGYEEHVVSRFALERLLSASPKERSFKAKAKTLKDIISSHVKEEEDDLFPKVEKAMSSDAQRDLGAKMKRLFDATVAAGWQKTLESEGPEVPMRTRRASASTTRV